MVNVLLGLREDVSPGVRECFWFQHDGKTSDSG